MPIVGSAAPTFDAVAVVDRDVVRVTWKELHSGRSLVLAFNPDLAANTVSELVVFTDGEDRLRGLCAKVAVISRQSEYGILSWVNQPRDEDGLGAYPFPIIADSDGQIARRYGMLLDDGTSLWGHFIIDQRGIIRQAEASTLPLPSNVHEIIRCIEALTTGTEEGVT